MRVIGHSLLLLVSITALGAAVHFGLAWLETSDFMVDPNGISVSRSTAYRAPDTEWLEFGLTEKGPVRVLSNCALRFLTGEETRYAIDYELIDSSDQIILSGRYHHRAKVTLLRNPQGSDDDLPVAKTSYAGSRYPSSNATEFWIESPGLALPGRLRIRIAPHDGAIVEVAIRAYQRSKLSPRKAKSAWERLSRRRRKQISRGFAVPADWLEPFETAAVTSHTWRPLGPKGVENEDYEERGLLIVNDPNFERYRAQTDAAIAETIREAEAT